MADKDEVMHEYGLEVSKIPPDEKFDSVVLAVSHNEFSRINLDKLKNFDKENFKS